MKTFVLTFILAFSFSSINALGQSKKDRAEDANMKKESVMQQETPPQPEVVKVEISNSELPDEVFIEVRDNYYNGDIIKAYKLMDNGKLTGYVAEVKNGPKKWTLEFDKNGNAVNKIVPDK